jgi:integrase
MTKKAVDRLAYNSALPQSQIIWDGSLPGFGCRVFSSGTKSFFLDYRVNGVKRRLTLGRYGVLTPQQAREKAVRALAEVSDGVDPVEERRTKRGVATLALASSEYLDEAKSKIKLRTVAEYKRLFDRYILPALGRKLVTDITVRDVARLHNAHRETPYQANRIRDSLAILMHWCELRGYRDRNTNPCRDVKKFPERQRERFLTVAEVGAIGAALTRAEREGLPPAPKLRKRPKSQRTAKHRPKSADSPIPANPFAVAAIRFLLFTGWRESEALTLRWSDVDFARKLVTLQDSKTGKSHRPLGAPALALLSDLPRVAGTPYVFPGSKTGQPLREMKRVWHAVRHAAGLDDVRLHDLRRTVASFSVASGHSLYITGSILGHARAETTQRYAHLRDDVRHAAADTVSELIAVALAGDERNRQRPERSEVESA